MGRVWPNIVGAAIALAGCAGVSQPAAYAFYQGKGKDTGQTPDCATSLPLFGVSLSQGLYPPNGSMTTRSGAACTLDVLFAYGAPSRVAVNQSPSHGALELQPARDGVGLNYRPASGYAGDDRFVVTANVGGRSWTIPVAVTVTR